MYPFQQWIAVSKKFIRKVIFELLYFGSFYSSNHCELCFSYFLMLTIRKKFKFQEPFQHQQPQQPKPIDSIQAITSSPSSDDLHTGNSSAERRSHVTRSSSAERRNHVAGNQQLDTEATIHLVRKGRTIFEVQKYFGKLQPNLLVCHAGPA